MDELEISGKRYISARRAAREYKYHSDYIGQLVRGKKLLGRKVGRSWYVELDSLTSYFGNEGMTIDPAPLVAKSVAEAPAPAPVESVKETPAPAVPAQPIVAAVPVAEVKRIPTRVAALDAAQPAQRSEEENNVSEYDASNDIEIKSAARDSIHIPVRVRRPSFEEQPAKKVSMLTYVSDDEPYVPVISKTERASIATTTVMPRTAEEAETVEEEQIKYKAPEKKSRGIKPVFSIAAIGVAALVLVMGSSILVSSHMVIEAGKTASVGFSLQ
jgi:hypothetical protein